MENTGNKSRTPSRCREWERNRRNKFNDAISRLGEIVKEINRAAAGSKEVENVQYPKVEIVEKAIVCLTTCIQEKAQLKAEILALQVKMDTEKKNKENKKDVSTQVFIGINKKNKSDKYVKVVMLQKSKRKALKEKPVVSNNTPTEARLDSSKPCTKETLNSTPKLPTLLPKTNGKDKKGPDNTIVVLPAAPYIFQQRPLLFPTVPPAFVLVDQNLQTLAKPPFPIVNRTSSDVTKTTMVNILPISAYSRPLSATKTKKSNIKARTDVIKKNKKAKFVVKSRQQKTEPNTITKTVYCEDKVNNKEKSNDNSELPKEDNLPDNNKIVPNKEKEICKENTTNESVMKDTPLTTKTVTTTSSYDISKEINKCPTKTVDVLSTTQTTKPKNTENVSEEKIIVQKNDNIGPTTLNNKNTKTSFADDKALPLEKDKNNKLPNILDTSLCESGVDGGNARLELAEEFLAASPTAAFLMSFPLVSGNRADSPADEAPAPLQVTPKDNNQRRNELQTQAIEYFDKNNPSNNSNNKPKPAEKLQSSSSAISSKQTLQGKYAENNVLHKPENAKIVCTTAPTNVSSENPFLNLTMPSLLPTTCSLSDSTFGLDFDCSITKSMPNQSSAYVSNSNIFYKSDPFSSVKSTIYSTSNISSGHEFNSFGLYPCAMEKYSSKNKTDFPNVEDNLMKIGSSRLTYDIDLGWSHKGFDFVNCTSTSNTYNKDNILTTSSGPYSTSYNPFNPDFHVPLVSNSSAKKDSSHKPISSFSETITSLYSQPTNLWSEDVPFYTNSNITKTLSSRQQNYLAVENTQINHKQNNSKNYEPKLITETGADPVIKPSHTTSTHQTSEKYKKSPSKTHINWMTSDVRPMQTNVNPTHLDMKEPNKLSYNQIDNNATKKQNHNDNNYFPISMHNFSSQPPQEDMQVWSSTRPAGPTEITIEPPPINLPTLVGDLALGPHEKKKSADLSNRGPSQNDIQNCNNFFSVTQLMNRSTDTNIPSRYQASSSDTQKLITTKQNLNDSNRKTMTHMDNHIPQPCYVFNDPKTINSYETMNQFSQNKAKVKSDKSTKTQKNSYSAEALIRGGTCNAKVQDSNATKFMIPPQKYNDFNPPQDSSVAQVSHFPPILDYSDNSYTGQQFSGTNLYNTTTNTISNSFYSNFMSGSSNLMPGNYTTGPFSSDFIDYNQSSECSYPNHKYPDLKMRNNPTMFQQEKGPNYKSSRRESATKHKMECSKKDSKKCQSKRAKLNTEPDDWNEGSHLLWQNKTPNKRHSNLMPEELAFPNYVGNQMATGQYQPDFINSHIMTSNMQPMGHNVDRSLTTLPVTSRANFNLSTIFPEITMKVQ